MKKFLSLMLAAMMLICCLPAASASAKDALPVKDEPNVFTIGSVTGAQPGTDVSIPIDITGPAYEATAFRLEVNYDPSLALATSYTYGPVTSGKPSGSMVICNIATPGFISFSIICPTGYLTGLGNLININFRTADDFDGVVNLDMTVKEFYYYPVGGQKHNLPHVDIDGYISSTTVHLVKFVDWNGTVLKQEYVAHGGDATPPSDPTRPGHVFAGWDGDYTNVTEDRTITATYHPNSYNVVFIDNFTGENVVLSEQTVPYGQSAVAPEPPEHKGYTFTGWSRDFSNVTSNMTVFALYELTVFTVRFLDWDNTVLSEQQVLPGESATAPEDPSRVGYTFMGWDDYSFLNVTSDLDIHAVYEVIKFRVTFRDWDGSYIIHQNVPYGQAATAPEPPVHIGHTFMGWDTDFSAVYSDLEVTALYDVAIFTVNFIDWDNTIIKSEQVEYGHDATPPEDPVREGYTFIGWDKDHHNITSAVNIYAQYEILTYTVTFLDMDGTVLDVQTVDHGSAAVAPETPVHVGLVFAGWDADISCVTSDMTVTAVYEVQTFTVTFVDMDGETVIEAQTVNYGEDAVAPEAPAHDGYEFIGWDIPFSSVTSDLTVTAQYERLQYTVIFLSREGDELGRSTVYYGEAAQVPEAPQYVGLIFAGWDADISFVTCDMTVTAVYIVETFTVYFYDLDGVTLIDLQIVEYGHDAIEPEAPQHDGYTFLGWSGDFTNVMSDLIIYAQYERNFLIVRFVDPYGELIEEQHVAYGDAATAPEPPEIPLKVFIGWDKDFSCVTEDMTVTAMYWLIGDVTFDGVVNTEDALRTLRAAMNLESFTADQITVADVNSDGVINTEDALHILRMAMGLE